jgi:hypothetical protein
VRVFPSRDSARTEKREGRCLQSPCRSRPFSGDRQLGFWGASTRLPNACHCLHRWFLASSSRSDDKSMGGYDQFSSLLFYILHIIYVVCSSVLSYYNMLFLSVLILQSSCLYCYLFISSCSAIIHEPCLYTYFIYMIYMLHMLCVLMIHIVMDIFEIVISMIKHILYVIIIMLIYRIKMIWKMPIFLTAPPPPFWRSLYIWLCLYIDAFDGYHQYTRLPYLYVRHIVTS